MVDLLRAFVCSYTYTKNVGSVKDSSSETWELANLEARAPDYAKRIFYHS